MVVLTVLAEPPILNLVLSLLVVRSIASTLFGAVGLVPVPHVVDKTKQELGLSQPWTAVVERFVLDFLNSESVLLVPILIVVVITVLDPVLALPTRHPLPSTSINNNQETVHLAYSLMVLLGLSLVQHNSSPLVLFHV